MSSSTGRNAASLTKFSPLSYTALTGQEHSPTTFVTRQNLYPTTSITPVGRNFQPFFHTNPQ